MNRTSSSIFPRISHVLATVSLNPIEERIGSVGTSSRATIHAQCCLCWRNWGSPTISIGPITRGGGNSGIRMRRKSWTIPWCLADPSVDRGCSLRIGIAAGHRISRAMTFASSRSSSTLMVNRGWSKN